MEQVRVPVQGFPKRQSFAGYHIQQALNCAGGVCDCAACVRLWPSGKCVDCESQVTCSGWFGIRFHDADSTFHCGFKRLVTSGHDRAVKELPSDAVFNKKPIDGLRELRGAGFSARSEPVLQVVLSKLSMESFDYVVDLEPFTRRYSPTTFLPDDVIIRGLPIRYV